MANSIAFPTHDDLEESELDMIVTGSQKEVAMIEGFANEMDEADMMEAIQFAHKVIRDVIELAWKNSTRRSTRPRKSTSHQRTMGFFERLNDSYYDDFKTAAQQVPGQARSCDCLPRHCVSKCDGRSDP